MIIGRCKNCNYTARYNSKFFTIAELQRHTISLPLEKWECDHLLIYEEEKQSSDNSKSRKTKHDYKTLTQYSETTPVEAVCN